MKQNLKILAASVLALAAVGTALAQQPVANLIENPFFEGPLDKSGLPIGWTKTQRGPEMAYQATVASPGRFSSKALQVEGDGEYCVVVGTRVPLEAGKSYTARGWVKLHGETSRATLKFDYFDAAKKYLGSSASVNANPKNREWQLVSTSGIFGRFPGAKFIAPACSIHGKGKASFDDLEMMPFDAPDAGENLLEDGSMECVSDRQPARWRLQFEKSGKAEILRRTAPVRHGWYSVELKGAAPWINVTSPRFPLEAGKTYTFSGAVRARLGSGKLQINYFKDSTYIGNHTSPPVTKNEWTDVSLVADPAQFPEANAISVVGAVGGKEVDVFFDDFKLKAAPTAPGSAARAN